jgi:hypothetical protein
MRERDGDATLVKDWRLLQNIEDEYVLFLAPKFTVVRVDYEPTRGDHPGREVPSQKVNQKIFFVVTIRQPMCVANQIPDAICLRAQFFGQRDKVALTIWERPGHGYPPSVRGRSLSFCSQLRGESISHDN